MTQAKRFGKIKSKYPVFSKNGDLAELIGVVLGDGHIQKFPRTERLLIFSNAKNEGFIKRYSYIVEKIFRKKPTVSKMKGAECVRISLYEKKIEERLGISSGARKDLNIIVPTWIQKNKKHIIRYLRGLYEAEGSISHHQGTYTHKFLFSNKNKSMLKNVEKLLRILGFSPHSGSNKVQVSKKHEIEELVRLLGFRMY